MTDRARAAGDADETPTYPLEPGPEEMAAMLAAASDRIVRHIESLAEQPASYDLDVGREVGRGLAEPLPQSGEAFETLLDTVFETLPHSFNTAGPGYLAYIPGGGLFPSAVAELIANAVNRYVGVWVAAPGLVQLELNVIRWFCEIVGYGSGSGGILTSGGSLSNLTALVTARRVRLGEEFSNGVMYTSDQTHHSVRKAAVLAGFPEAAVREIPSDDRQKIQVGALMEAITADRRTGREPFLVVGSAGTTNTGAVDDLSGLADVAAREDLWLHVDAAYGGFFHLTERGRAAMAGLERADSITLDPHKGLFLPYGTGCLLMREEEALRRAHATFADYMPVMQHDADFVDFCDLSPELSRDFRGLRVWLPLKLFGIEAFRDALDEKLDLARWAAEELRTIPGMRIVCEPELSLVSFRLEPPDLTPAQLDALNRELMLRINTKQNVYLTGTTVAGEFAIRICVLSFRTHRDRMEQCLTDIRAAVRDVIAAGGREA